MRASVDTSRDNFTLLRILQQPIRPWTSSKIFWTTSISKTRKNSLDARSRPIIFLLFYWAFNQTLSDPFQWANDTRIEEKENQESFTDNKCWRITGSSGEESKWMIWIFSPSSSPFAFVNVKPSTESLYSGICFLWFYSILLFRFSSPPSNDMIRGSAWGHLLISRETLLGSQEFHFRCVGLWGIDTFRLPARFAGCDTRFCWFDLPKRCVLMWASGDRSRESCCDVITASLCCSNDRRSASDDHVGHPKEALMACTNTQRCAAFSREFWASWRII